VIPPHFSGCFGCGPSHPTGLHLRATVGEDVSLNAVFRVTEEHQGAPGLAHGGVLATAFDEAMGYVNALLRLPAVTARLETHYLRPVPVGRDLHIHARCVGVDRRRIYIRADGRLDAPDGPRALRAASLFVVVAVEHFSTHGRGPLSAEMAEGARGTYNP
jgi:acyl-coenzyme A thioesterase PaaI-like protein